MKGVKIGFSVSKTRKLCIIHAFHHSTQYHMVVRLKACGNATMGGRAYGFRAQEWNPQLAAENRNLLSHNTVTTKMTHMCISTGSDTSQFGVPITTEGDVPRKTSVHTANVDTKMN